MIDFENKKYLKLKHDDSFGRKVQELLVENEVVLDSFKSMRDGVVFTNKRIITVNVQGMTGKKKNFTSIPYSKISVYSIETSGVFDLDCELELFVSGLETLITFEFKGKTNILEISQNISQEALK